jgi:hypothetical protein
MGEMRDSRLRPDDAVGQLDQPVDPDEQPGAVNETTASWTRAADRTEARW